MDIPLPEHDYSVTNWVGENGIIYTNNYVQNSIEIGGLYLYIVEGSILLLFNFYFASKIFLNHKLRNQKEYIIVGSNMLFDAMLGLGYLYAGIFRMMMYYNETCKFSQNALFDSKSAL